MTLMEFLHPLKGGSLRDLCLAAMYYHQRYESVSEVTVDGLRALLKRARVPRAATINVAQVLSAAAPYVHSPGKQGSKFLWEITASGQERVRELLNPCGRRVAQPLGLDLPFEEVAQTATVLVGPHVGALA